MSPSRAGTSRTTGRTSRRRPRARPGCWRHSQEVGLARAVGLRGRVLDFDHDPGSSRCHQSCLSCMSRRQSRPVSSSWTSSPPPSRTRRSSPNRSTRTRRRSTFRSPSISSTVIVPGSVITCWSTCTPCHAQTSVPSPQASAGPSAPWRRPRSSRRIASGRSETIASPSSAHHGPADEPARAGRRSGPRATRARQAAATAGRRTRHEWRRAAASRRRTEPAASPGARSLRSRRSRASRSRSAGWWRRTARGRGRSPSCPRWRSSRSRADGRRGRRARSPIASASNGAARDSVASGGALRATRIAAHRLTLSAEARLRLRAPSSRSSSRCSRRRRQAGSRSNGWASACQSRRSPLPTSPRVCVPRSHVRVSAAKAATTIPAAGDGTHWMRGSPLPAYRARIAASARGRSRARSTWRGRARRPRGCGGVGQGSLVVGTNGRHQSITRRHEGVLTGAGTYSRWMTMRY